MTKRIIRLPKTKKKTGLCRTAIYDGMQAGTFPKQIPIGPRAVGWDESEIDAWIDQKIQAARNRRAES